jgi:hypothetical protein
MVFVLGSAALHDIVPIVKAEGLIIATEKEV